MIQAVLDLLGEEDDPELWRVVLDTVLAELPEAEREPGTLVEVGRCSHWLRPHQSRWTADGGFAWPVGYGSATGGWSTRALPQFDWSVVLAWTGAGWVIAQDKSARRAVRIAVPSRTTRHGQAAVHAVWMTGREKQVRFYGFRLKSGQWRCTASTAFGKGRHSYA